jgi:hypothetical protein
MAGDLASAQPLHSRPWHLFLRLHTSLFVLLALAGCVFLASGDPILVAGGVMLLLCAPAAFWLLSGRYWAVYLTSTELVARRLFRTRRVPRSALKAIIKPWYARSLYGFYWDERRLLVRDERPISFICSRRGLEQLKPLLATREGDG